MRFLPFLTGILFFSFSIQADETKVPEGFYCKATAWRAYENLPSKTERVFWNAGAHAVIEHARQNAENESQGALGKFEPAVRGAKRFTQDLHFDGDTSIRIHALLFPTEPKWENKGNFIFELVNRKDGKITHIFGRDGEAWNEGEVSADLSNLDVKNAYLAMGVSPYDDQGYHKLAPLIVSKALPEGSVVGAIVHCSPKF